MAPPALDTGRQGRVYATPGPERDAFLTIVEQFNLSTSGYTHVLTSFHLHATPLGAA
jgi:hypothetical protein